MKEYKHRDVVYEDIYDFDDINGLSIGPKMSGKPFTIDEFGDIVRPKYHPKVKDDRVRLPPVLVGNTLVSSSNSTLTNRIGNSTAKIWNTNTITKGRDLFNGHHTTKAYQRNMAAGYDRYTKSESVNYDELYRSLMENSHGRSIEKSPQVMEYERRNNIRRYPDLTAMVTKNTECVPPPSSEELGVGNVFMRRIREYEESIKTRPAQHVSTYKPTPPTAPKPDNEKLSYSRARRYLHETTRRVGPQ